MMNTKSRVIVLAGLFVALLVVNENRAEAGHRHARRAEYLVVQSGQVATYVARTRRAVRRSLRYQRRHAPVVAPTAPVVIPTTPTVGPMAGQIVGWRSPAGYFYRASYHSAVMAPFPMSLSLQPGPSLGPAAPAPTPQNSGSLEPMPEMIPAPPAEPQW